MSSSLLCALSGSHPETPVLSKTGYLFEKSVITKYLKANGDVCPVTGEPLTVNDLTEIKGACLHSSLYPNYVFVGGRVM